MKGPIDPYTAVLTIAGATAVYISYHDPALGSAILVGVGVVGLLYMLFRK